MKALFVCNQNQNRSKTAEKIFNNKFTTKSAGLYNKRPLTKQQIVWADVIFVMEDEQRSEIAKRFPKQYLQKRILDLDVPDIYEYNNPKLVKVLKSKVEEYTNLF